MKYFHEFSGFLVYFSFYVTNSLLTHYLACLHDQNKSAFWRAGFYPANQSNLKSFQKALIGWKNAGSPKKPLLLWSCKQANYGHEEMAVHLVMARWAWPLAKNIKLKCNIVSFEFLQPILYSFVWNNSYAFCFRALWSFATAWGQLTSFNKTSIMTLHLIRVTKQSNVGDMSMFLNCG